MAEKFAVLALAATLTACGESASGSTTSGAGGSSSTTGTEGSGTTGSGLTSGGIGGSGTSGGTTSGSGTGGGGTAQSEVPTSSSDALFAYLKSGAYTSFPAESSVHPSTGPHGGSVRTYLNPALNASLSAGNAEHPLHAAVVKELYGGGSSVTGWAVAVKTQAASAGGKGWYWYEIYSTTDPSGALGGANGVPLCVNCHTAGKDFILTPFPLQ